MSDIGMRIHILFAGALSLIYIACLGGCASGRLPLIETYHGVTSDEGKVGDCHGEPKDLFSGPQSRLTFQRGPTTVTINSEYLSGIIFGRWPWAELSISIKATPVNSIRLDWAGFQAMDGKTGQVVIVPQPLVRMHYFKDDFWGKNFGHFKQFNPGDDLKVDNSMVFPNSIVVYGIELNFKQNVPEAFTFRF